MHQRIGLLLGVAVLAVSCSTNPNPPIGERGPLNSSAERLLSDARARADSLTSFAFRSVTELPGSAALQRTVIDGRATVPNRVAYSVTVGTSRTDIVQIDGTVYSRSGPGGQWRLQASTETLASPVVVLQAVLEAADDPTDAGAVTFDGRSAQLIEVILTAEEVRRTGLLNAAGGSDVPITLALDQQGRVLRLALSLPVRGGSTTGTLRQVTTYGSFGAVSPVDAPL